MNNMAYCEIGGMLIYSLHDDMWSVDTLGISCKAPEGANKRPLPKIRDA